MKSGCRSNTSDKARKLAAEEKGGVAYDTPAQVAANADYIFLCVGDTAMSQKVILGGEWRYPRSPSGNRGGRRQHHRSQR